MLKSFGFSIEQELTERINAIMHDLNTSVNVKESFIIEDLEIGIVIYGREELINDQWHNVKDNQRDKNTSCFYCKDV